MRIADMEAREKRWPMLVVWHWIVVHVLSIPCIIRLEFRRQLRMPDLFKGAPDWFVEVWAITDDNDSPKEAAIAAQARRELELRERQRALKEPKP